MPDMGQVNIIVSGRSYRMSCDDGEEEHLAGLGQRFDAAIDELRSGFGEIGDQRLTVMAAILMTDRLDESERKIQALEEELKLAQGSGKTVSDQYESLNARLAQGLEKAAQRVEGLAGLLDAESRDPASES
jgi:cell division protein ZapA